MFSSRRRLSFYGILVLQLTHILSLVLAESPEVSCSFASLSVIDLNFWRQSVVIFA